MSTMAPPLLTSDDVCALANVTYRKLNYWCTGSVVFPIGPHRPGSGFPRRFTPEEARVIAAVARLSELGVGLNELRRAAHDLRQLDEWTGTVVVSRHGTVLRASSHASLGEACFLLNLGVIAQRARAAA